VAEALGGEPATAWPSVVELVPAGSKVTLSGTVFFAAPAPVGSR
jgi:hypothetical protein